MVTIHGNYTNKTNGTLVHWVHPTTKRGQYGNIVGAEGQFVMVKDGIVTEGILPEWIDFVSAENK